MRISKTIEENKVKRIRGHAEVHAEVRWIDRGDGVQERVIDAFRVEHRDGSVEFASTSQEAMHQIVTRDNRARRVSGSTRVARLFTFG